MVAGVDGQGREQRGVLEEQVMQLHSYKEHLLQDGHL
jgi:hypothetical protein